MPSNTLTLLISPHVAPSRSSIAPPALGCIDPGGAVSSWSRCASPHASRRQRDTKKINNKGNYYCKHLGAACDFLLIDISSSEVINWILRTGITFDSIYFYGDNPPIHISYSSTPRFKIWQFTSLCPIHYINVSVFTNL